MEASCKWLLQTLGTPTPSSLAAVQARHRARDDAFDLPEVLAFLPEKQHERFCTLLRAAFEPSLKHVSTCAAEESEANGEDIDALRTAAEITWLFVHERKEPPPPPIRAIIYLLHDSLLALPEGAIQNQVAKLCEWLWEVGGDEMGKAVPQTMLFLLLRSFGGEKEALQSEGGKKGGSAADVKRVYAMRRALRCLELAEAAEEAATIRALLLRCASSAQYLRAESGRKFLAFLLTFGDIRDACLDVLVAQVGTVRRGWAKFYGTVFLLAWKTEKSEWLSTALMGITEKAICAGSEPFATNLRTVLAAFHANKRVSGVDLLLHRVYGPVLYKNLMVANPVVRKNAVTILVDAFPIHDPGSQMEDIEKAIGLQCGKMLELLSDPAPIVRKATVEGVGRVIGMLWELVPPSFVKRMIDVITTKLAFDSASAQVRVAVFEALEFIARNPFAYQLLSISLPRLRSLIHDNVERVRLAFLDLLITIKDKRKKSLRYFDVVSLEELLIRLPVESTAASTKIMSLIVTSYFPLQRKGKTAEEVASSQVRACLSLLNSNREAAARFYPNLNLHIPPGPLCEFAMRLAAIALDAPLDTDASKSRDRAAQARVRKAKQPTKRKPRSNRNVENVPPANSNIQRPTNDQQETQLADKILDRVTLLTVVADVLTSVTPSLGKDANRRLRDYIDDIFSGDALTSYLVEEDNTCQSRAVSWRIASCVSSTRIAPVTKLWQEQLGTAPEWPRATETDKQNFASFISSLLLCGFRWSKISHLSAAMKAWSVEASTGGKTREGRSKSLKRSGQTRASSAELASHRGWSAAFALRTAASVMIQNVELRQEVGHVLHRTPSSGTDRQRNVSGVAEVFCAVRKGCTGAAEHFLEHRNQRETAGGKELSCFETLGFLKETYQLVLAYCADARTCASMSGEIKELLQWSAAVSLVENATKLNKWFGAALASLILAFVADAVAIGRIDEKDVAVVADIARNVRKHLDMSEPARVSRPVVELLRISYQLDQRASQEAELSLNVENEKRSVRQDSSCAVLCGGSKVALTAACEILNECEVAGDRMVGSLAKLNVVDEFMLDTIVAMRLSSEPSVLSSVMSSMLRSCFEDAEAAEQNLLAATICNAVRGAVTGASKRSAVSSAELYRTLVSYIRAEDDRETGMQAMTNFSRFVINAVAEYYENVEELPTEDARAFFAVVDHLLVTELSDVSDVTRDAKRVNEAVMEIEKSLASLKSMCLSSAVDSPKEKTPDAADP